MSVVHGDCLDVMASMEPESISAIVTDPPYGLGFMGKAWDHGAPGVPFWREMLRVAKPSSYLLAFGGTRTVHRIATSIEDAGWIIRDMLVWAYASGFPKSKASLKPAWEPIVMARKPGPLRMLAIDACRIPFASSLDAAAAAAAAADSYATHTVRDGSYPTPSLGKLGPRPRRGVTSLQPQPQPQPQPHEDGRWPSNVLLTDPIFDGDTAGVVGGGWTQSNDPGTTHVQADGWGHSAERRNAGYGGDSGTYSRFFVIPKADRTDREPVLRTDRERIFGDGLSTETKSANPTARHNIHPTVKPTDLMRHLVRLVTPAGGTVLDPFLGSGTTGLACELEGFPWIGIEKEAEYVAIAEARLNGTQRGLGLPA